MKKIIFFSTNRSDFDLQKNIILKLQNNTKCYLVCSGQHFSKKDGYSFHHIQRSKIKNLIKIKQNLNSNLTDYKFMYKINDMLIKTKPDLCCVIGDRLEILHIAIIIYSQNIPILHFCGGEITKGSKDDIHRHCITKLSNYHIVTTKEHKKRVVQLGENPKNIYNFGSLSIENIKKIKKIKKAIIEKKLKISLNKKNYIVTLHPDSLNIKQNYKVFFNTLTKIKKSNFYITSSNQDRGGNMIYDLIKNICKKKNFFYLKNLGQKNYIHLARYMNAVIGNSSSGISEIPSVKIPTINVGKRQNGRPQSLSIINCNYSQRQIISAINKANNKKFLRKIKKAKNLFYKKNSLINSVNKIKKIIQIKNHKKNFFFDINF